jgi:superfamily II DNA helicase RecQ
MAACTRCIARSAPLERECWLAGPVRLRIWVASDTPDLDLFATLRAWRRAEAARQKAPPYVIFSDRTLAEIATARPADAAALSRVSGVGETKLARYGPSVLALVAGETPPDA